MARYNIGQTVTFNYGLIDNPATGTITNVISDTSLGGTMDSYQVESGERHYTVSNPDILSVADEVEITPITLDNSLGGRNTNAPSWFQTFEREVRRLSRDLNETELPIHGGPVVPETQNDQRLIDVTFENEGRQVTIDDYLPSFSSSSLKSFQLLRTDVTNITPFCTIAPRISGTHISFEDTIGRVWINEYQRHDFRRVIREINTIDSRGVAWTTLSNYVVQSNPAMSTKPSHSSRPKHLKKLRRKYDKMPLILDEKNYDSKKYIA